MHFEYQILHADTLVSEVDLNEMGKQRWSLTSVVNNENGYYYIFQRLVLPVGLPIPRAVPKIVGIENLPSRLDEAFNSVNNQ